STTGPRLPPRSCSSRAPSASARPSKKKTPEVPGVFKRRASQEDLGLTRAEFRTLARLSTPQKIQAFIDAIPQNFEVGGQTCLSVREVLSQRRAMCIEGAMVAACALWINGEPPLLMDLKAKGDFDHVITV